LLLYLKSIMDKVIYKYMLGSMVLNGLSKTYEVWNAKVKRYDYTRKSPSGYVENDMLLGEKFGVIALNVLLGPFKLPYTILDNLNKIDIMMRNENLEDYGYNKVKFVCDYY
jgi:hypothetical protein